MENKDAVGNYYTIGHLVQFTGLTDRTVRNYISSGILTGEKINGLWHFTPEQVDAFLKDPAVRTSILAKKNGLVYDFMAFENAPRDRSCMILNFPGEKWEDLTAYFCTAINQGKACDLQFSFESLQGTPRVILKGNTEDVLGLVNGWYEK